MAKHLVTSALPYVNNIPHLGNLIGSTLSADVFARHKRLQGHEVLYVCGADEHGTMTEIKAKEEGLTPKQLCDKYGKIHKDIYDWFKISFDVWGRTHTDSQAEITQSIFTDLRNNGYIYEEEIAQLYDEKAEQFLSDRFVEGICPHCGEQGARGDQCDACQQLITATNLKDPVSKLTGTTPVVKHTKHLFIDLPKLKEKLAPWVKSQEDKWSKNTVTTTRDWLADIKPRAITRDLSWGITVPLQGYENKVFYVWFDAPIGYISITAHDRDDWEQWWKDEDVTLTQFMGKDNIVFHSVIFPASLLGTGKTWNLVDTINTTEFLNMEEGKFSKSRKTGIFGDDCIALEKEYGIPADVWRYYLLATRPESADSVFAWKDFQARTNNELIANLGNLVHRTLHFAHTKCRDITPTRPDQGIEDLNERIQAAHKHLDESSLKPALQEIMAVSKEANGLFQRMAPWEDLKTDPQVAAGKIQVLAELVRDVAILIKPYLPQTSTRILCMLGLQSQTYKDIQTPLPDDWTKNLEEPKTLFERLEDDLIDTLKQRFSPKTMDLDLRVAKITQAKDHPDADKLLVLTLDLGDETRQLVAGLKGHYGLEELEDTKIVVVANLEPAKLRGEKSEGMLLASENQDGVIGLVRPEAAVGTRITIGGQRGTTQITFDQFMQHTLQSSPEGVTVDGTPLDIAVSIDKDAYGTVR